MVGTSGKDVSGGDGVYGFTPGGVSKFPAPGSECFVSMHGCVCADMSGENSKNEDTTCTYVSVDCCG